MDGIVFQEPPRPLSGMRNVCIGRGVIIGLVLCGVVLFPGRLHAAGTLLERAERGDPKAQFRMGMDYLNGRDVPRDSKKAVYWLRKSALRGNSWAQVWLGLAYRNGWGVPKDETKAMKWWRKAAEAGNPWARDRFNGEY